MTGGLLQLSTSGSSDLFLYGNPQITAFKVIYRRYTNFSIENIVFDFDDEVGFGTTSSIILPKVGDLVHKIYVAITIPTIKLTRTPPGTNLTSQLQTAQAQYTNVINFMQINIQAYRNGVEEYNSVNTTTQDMLDAISQTYNIDNFSAAIKIPFEQALFGTGYVYSQISIEDIADSFEDNNNIVLPSVTKLQIYNAMQLGLQNSISVQNYFYQQIISLQNQIAEATNVNAKFAWVKRLGHIIMDSIQLTIGGDIIDKHYGDWINIWYELSSNSYLDKVYNKMIGNVPELTNVDRTIKPEYTLYVPLQFWFCRNNGLALPLIALEYHDVEIKIVFKNIEQCGYIGEFTEAQLSNPTTKSSLISQYNITSLVDYVEDTGLDISASLWIDYIYLDSNERKKFAQASHEYLIEQLQVINFTDVSGTMYSAASVAAAAVSSSFLVTGRPCAAHAARPASRAVIGALRAWAARSAVAGSQVAGSASGRLSAFLTLLSVPPSSARTAATGNLPKSPAPSIGLYPMSQRFTSSCGSFALTASERIPMCAPAAPIPEFRAISGQPSGRLRCRSRPRRSLTIRRRPKGEARIARIGPGAYPWASRERSTYCMMPPCR